MAYLSKEQYDYRRESAARRMAENAEIETLSEEQHEALAEICRMRHELHCNPESIFLTDSSDYTEYSRYVSNLDGDERNFSRIAEEAGLPVLNIELFDDYDNDRAGEWDEDYDYEVSLRATLDYVERLNTTIENWLRAIDEEHGTDYCPSGALRVF